MPAWCPLALCLVAVVTAGCLYVDDINHRPVAAVTLSKQSNPPDPTDPSGKTVLPGPPYYKGGYADFDPRGSSDPDLGDQLHYRWFVDDTEACIGKDPASFACSTPEAGTPAGIMRFTIKAAGSYVVSVIAVDSHGAQSERAFAGAVTVENALPMPGIYVDGASQRSECGDYPVGTGLELQGHSNDYDSPQDLAKSFQWQLTMVPEGSKMAGIGNTCAPPPSTTMYPDTPKGYSDEKETAACLWPDVPGTYVVQFGVTDDPSNTNLVTTTQTIVVAHDRPPCMDGWSPDVGEYVLPSTEMAHFEVDEVLDDKDRYPGGTARFLWQLWRESDPTWRAIAGYALPSLDLDPSDFALDEEVQLRVEAEDRVDRSSLDAACDPTAALCDLSSLVPPSDICVPSGTTCEEWVTWTVRFH